MIYIPLPRASLGPARVRTEGHGVPGTFGTVSEFRDVVFEDVVFDTNRF